MASRRPRRGLASIPSPVVGIDVQDNEPYIICDSKTWTKNLCQSDQLTPFAMQTASSSATVLELWHR